MIVLTIIFMIITKLIEIAVKHTKLTLMIFFPFLPPPGYNSYLLSALGYVFVLKKLLFRDAFKKLGHKNVIRGSTCPKEKKKKFT